MSENPSSGERARSLFASGPHLTQGILNGTREVSQVEREGFSATDTTGASPMVLGYRPVPRETSKRFPIPKRHAVRIE